MTMRPAGRPDISGGKPTVVQAITRLNIGGPGRHVLDAATGLADTYAIRIATGTPLPAEGEMDATGLTVDRLPMVREIAPQTDVVALARMRRLLRRHDVALVHSHMAKAGSIARLAATSIHPRPRTIHTFHGHVLNGYFHSFAESTFARIERRLARRTDRLVAVSDEIRDALLDLGIGRPSQYEVVPVGIDLASYSAGAGPSGRLRAALGLPSDVPLIGVAARLVAVKDHATLIDAVAQLPDVHLAILGDGELRGSLESKVSMLGLSSRVHFTGWWTDMPGALTDIDVAVLTSRNEGTPLSLIEGAAAGKATVATNVGGVPSVVLDGRTGVLVPPGNAHAVASALGGLMKDPERRRTMGTAARVHVHAEFGLEHSIRRLRELYASVL